MNSAFDVHEVLITRGDVQGAPEYHRDKIFTRYNCVAVHPADSPGKCHEIAQTRAGHDKCVVELILWEGFTQISQWVSDLPFSLSLSMQAQRDLQRVYEHCVFHLLTPIAPLH